MRSFVVSQARTILACWIAAVGIVASRADEAAATDEERGVTSPGPAGDRVSRTTTSTIPTSGKWRMEGPILSASMFSPLGRLTSGTRGDEHWDMNWELADDHGLITEITRRGDAVVRKEYIRLTLENDILVRERKTLETWGAGGRRTFETAICGHHDAPHCAGRKKFFLGSKEVEKWLAACGGKNGIASQDAGEACPLDDRLKVPDEALEKFASTRWLGYDDKGRETVVVHSNSKVSRGSFTLWMDETARAAKLAYGENPSPAPLRRSRNPDDELPWRNTWHLRVQAQAVDNEGTRRTDLPRVVWFIHSFTDRDFNTTIERRVFVVRQEMDYASGPRPKIKSYSIEHYLSNTRRRPPKRGAWDLGPDACKEYEVRIEDVQDGDPALQGEWITKVVPRGEAFRKFAEAEGFQALLSPTEQHEATPGEKQPEGQPKP